jgi:hypothetical protein
MHKTFLSENPKGRDHFGDLGIYGRIILKLILKLSGVGLWSGFKWFGIGSSGGLS